MEQNENGLDNIVFAQALSHEQLLNNREGISSSVSPFSPLCEPETRVPCAACNDKESLSKMLFSFIHVALARRLLLRRPREELVNQGIMPGL